MSPRTTRSGKSRRPAIRVRFREGRDFQAAYQRDITHGGIFLRTENARPLRAQLRVVLTMPDGSAVELRGEVVRSIPPADATPEQPAGMAVAFQDLDAEKRRQLEVYLVDLKRRTLAPKGAAMAPLTKELDDRQLLRRLCWLLCEGALDDRAIEAIFGLPRDAPATLRARLCERLRALLSPDDPPPYLGWQDARAVIRVLASLENKAKGSAS